MIAITGMNVDRINKWGSGAILLVKFSTRICSIVNQEPVMMLVKASVQESQVLNLMVQL